MRSWPSSINVCGQASRRLRSRVRGEEGIKYHEMSAVHIRIGWQPGDSIISAREYRRNALVHPTHRLKHFFSIAVKVFEQNISKICFEDRVHFKLKNILTTAFSDYSFTCVQHDIKDLLINFNLKFIFSWTTNVNKILHGRNRSIYNDPIKALALKYFENHK